MAESVLGVAIKGCQLLVVKVIYKGKKEGFLTFFS